MLAIFLMFSGNYYAQNHASIIGWCLLHAPHVTKTWKNWQKISKLEVICQICQTFLLAKVSYHMVYESHLC